MADCTIAPSAVSTPPPTFADPPASQGAVVHAGGKVEPENVFGATGVVSSPSSEFATTAVPNVPARKSLAVVSPTELASTTGCSTEAEAGAICVTGAIVATTAKVTTV